MVLGVEVALRCHGRQGKAAPEGNDPVSQHDEYEHDQSTLADIYRRLEEGFDRQLNRMKSYFDDFTEKMRETGQRLTGLEHEARQPRLAMEADVTPDTKTRKRTEDAAADQAKHGNRSRSDVSDQLR